MNQILKLTKIVVCFSFIATGCIQDNFWKSGVSNGRFDGSLLEYMDAPGAFLRLGFHGADGAACRGSHGAPVRGK